jgi:hypothetical protein
MSDTLSLFQANQSLFSLLNDGNREAANTNMVVSNHFHSVKILLFSSARSRDFDGTPGTNKYWCSVPHYLSDIRNIYIKADRFPLMMLTAANKEKKQF